MVPQTLYDLYFVSHSSHQTSKFPSLFGDTCFGSEGSSSKSFKAIIMIKGDEEMCTGEGGERLNGKLSVKGGRGEKTRIP